MLLRAGERPVTELAQELGMTQPGASKHLRVLREVGLVRDRLFEGVDAGRVALEQVRGEPRQRVTHLTYAVRQR